MRRAPAVTVAIVALATLVVGAITLGHPLLKRESRVTVTGAPAPIYAVSTVKVAPGQTMCATRVLLNERTQVASLVVEGSKTPSPPLVATASGPGYRAGPVQVPAGPAGRHGVNVPLDTPKQDVLGRLCLRNDGWTRVAFIGTDEFRSLTRETTVVGGKTIPTDVTLSFYERTPTSALAELPGMVHRMTIGRGFLGMGWLVWIVLALAFVGVPVLLLRTLHGVLAADG